MTAIIILVGVVAGLLILGKIAKIANRFGLKTPIGDIRRFIDQMMRGGAHGARLELRHTSSKRVISFVKLIPRDAPTRFFMELDSRHCSMAEFEAAQGIFRDHGIRFQMEEVGDGKQSWRCLVAEFGPDVEQAEEAAQLVFREAFGLGPEAMFRAGIVGGLDVRQFAWRGWDREFGDASKGEGADRR